MTLQPIEPAAFLQISNQHETTRAGLLFAFPGVLDGFSGGDERVAKMGGVPGGLHFGDSLRGDGVALGSVHGGPLLEADQGADLIVEREHGDLIGRRGVLQGSFGPGHRIGPNAVTFHAGAGVHEDHDLRGGGAGRSGRHWLPEKRTGEREGEQADGEAAEQQQKNIFDPVAPGHARRRGFEKHQRTENLLLARGTADEMKHHRQRNRESAEQEEWGEEAHLARQPKAESNRFVKPETRHVTPKAWKILAGG